MRETRTVQKSIFDFYAEHETGKGLNALSEYLDANLEILDTIMADLVEQNATDIGRKGMTAESVLRCMLLKQIMGFSYDQMAFHLMDSHTFSTFARINDRKPPGRSTLQANIRRIHPESLKSVFDHLVKKGLVDKNISLDQIRIDSTVVEPKARQKPELK